MVGTYAVPAPGLPAVPAGPENRGEPPVGLAYQLIVDPAEPNALNVTGPPPQTVSLATLDMEAVGITDTNTGEDVPEKPEEVQVTTH